MVKKEKIIMLYQTVEVDMAPENNQEQWKKWGTFKQLEKYVEETLLRLAVDEMTKKWNILKDVEDPKKKLRVMARHLILVKPETVLEMLRMSNPKIRGWRCIPEEVKS